MTFSFFISLPTMPYFFTFPTRRSSDLAVASALFGYHWIRSGAPISNQLREANSAPLNGSSGTRSEEHTSELQPPDHLVCRLRLEKTKGELLVALDSHRSPY